MSKDPEAILKVIEDIFLDTFADDSYQFSMDTNSDDVEEWDSLNHIRLLTSIEAEFDIQFDLSEIEQLASVSDMVSTVASKIS